MKKIFFGGVATLGLVALATLNMNLNSQKTDLPSMLLHGVEALASSERGCISRSGANNGDCTTDGTYYFCENSIMFHDCVKGEYPN